jgi:low affinity Fe/Cu permease
MVYLAGIVVVLAWIVSGPCFNFLQQWQFAIMAGTSTATLLLVLILQHTDYRQIKAIQHKLDELLGAVERARNDLVHLETKPEEQIDSLDEEFGADAAW